jgi:hypothetical protein
MIFITEGAERRRNRKSMEDFYYAVIRSILREGVTDNSTITKLKEMKVKIVRLQKTE